MAGSLLAMLKNTPTRMCAVCQKQTKTYIHVGPTTLCLVCWDKTQKVEGAVQATKPKELTDAEYQQYVDSVAAKLAKSLAPMVGKHLKQHIQEPKLVQPGKKTEEKEPAPLTTKKRIIDL